VLVVPPAAGKGPVDYARIHRDRRIAAYIPHFFAAPAIVANTDLVLTTGRRVARHFATALDLQLFEPPVSLPPLRVSMIWHGRTEQDSAATWLRGVVRAATRDLLAKERPARAASAPLRRGFGTGAEK
jgi:DNA-binding transcriptional LysR family regulator